MNVVKCSLCGAEMKRNGKMSAGRTRWRCKACGASTTGCVDNSAKRLDEFLIWLLSKERQAGMLGADRTFRRRMQEFWHVWPLPPVTGGVCRVAFVDGICLARNVCVLIARSEERVLGWYVARSENPRAYKALMALIVLPDVVVTDGGSGFQKARREMWEHRGLSLERRIKAAHWWCYMHTEYPLPAAEILKVMPTEASIAKEMRAISCESRASRGPQRWGDGLVWEELHRSTPWRRDWD